MNKKQINEYDTKTFATEEEVKEWGSTYKQGDVIPDRIRATIMKELEEKTRKMEKSVDEIMRRLNED